MTTKYRKKPVEIEAQQLDLLATTADAQDLARWCGGTVRTALAKPTDPATITPYIDIRTLEGTMTASPGDWIIRGVQGEFYPCKPDIFAATYEEVGDDPTDEFIYERGLNA